MENHSIVLYSKSGVHTWGLTGFKLCRHALWQYNDLLVFVSAPNSCLDNNGGCHVFATCSNDQVKCTCRPGYEGDGYYCQMKDPCTVNNGGCDANATCHFKGPVSRYAQPGTNFIAVSKRDVSFANFICNVAYLIRIINITWYPILVSLSQP